MVLQKELRNLCFYAFDDERINEFICLRFWRRKNLGIYVSTLFTTKEFRLNNNNKQNNPYFWPAKSDDCKKNLFYRRLSVIDVIYTTSLLPFEQFGSFTIFILSYLNTFNFRAPFIFAPLIFATLIFAHPSKMNFRAPFNFRASHNFMTTFGVFSDEKYR